MALIDGEGLSYVEQVGLRRTSARATGTRLEWLCASCPGADMTRLRLDRPGRWRSSGRVQPEG